MKPFRVFAVVLLSCWLCVGKLFAASPEVEKARQNGAQGRVTLRVVDSTGKPVEKAELSVAFWASDSSENAVVSEGKTDISGSYVAAGKTIHSMNYTIAKDGYYKTTGEYWFYRRGEDCVKDGRWKPWNPTNTVVLKEHRNPIAMYVKYVDAPVPVRNVPVGFDLEVGDWVTPYGKGKQSDLFIAYTAKVQDLWNGSLELIIACTNKMEGFFRAQKDMRSDFRSEYEAPISGYQLEVQFAFVTTTDRDVKVEKLGDTEYLAFRVKTVLDDKGSIVSARYGKIYGPIEFGVGKEHHIRFSYYLNPTANDRDIEFDASRNLLVNPGRVQVNMP